MSEREPRSVAQLLCLIVRECSAHPRPLSPNALDEAERFAERFALSSRSELELELVLV